MSREIKFRAWDGQVMRMWQWETDLRKFTAEELFIQGNRHQGNYRWPLMQYTGLKAMNGEIYEGDIVKDRYGSIDVVDDAILGDWIYRNHHEALDMPGRDLGNQLLIMGNIYEHPELLDHD